MAECWYEGACFKRTFSFRFGDCDERKKASIYSIMRLLSEIAGDDYEGRGLGHDVLQKRNQAFLVSRMSLSFSRIPNFSEKVVACTWERFVKGPFFYRDYEIIGEDGELIVAGSSLWLLVDPNSREILRPENLKIGTRQNEPRKSACSECSRIKMPDLLPIIGNRPIFYSDIDGNGHVNNAVYGKIASDFLPEKCRCSDIKTFSINFNMEIRKNETLVVRGAETETGFVLQGISNDTQNFSCEFGF